MSNIKDIVIPEDHKPSALVNDAGDITFTTPNVTQLKTLTERKLLQEMPDPDERIVSLYEHRHFFENLEFADILLTNACNLSCTYCYEQHNKDFGRYTPEMLRQVWDWLRDINEYFPKYIQFFGGEPLIHKDLILRFMRENKDELKRMEGKMVCSITTNGLLLKKDFIDEFFSYPGTKMMISLDTIREEYDHRGIGQTKIDKLLDTIEYVASKVDNPANFAIRATIGREAAPYVTEFWNELYSRGVKQMIFHPLILSYGQGYVEWEEDEWNTFTSDIKNIIKSHPDIAHFQVAEGVGVKGKTNCMVGSDEIAVDPSGDFSGCYFFTNRKNTGTGKMLLGNILKDQFYIDRHDDMAKAYDTMYDEHEECKTCHVKNLCYQCPAGNLSTSGQLFKPDGMCKRFIELYSDCKDLLTQNQFRNKVEATMTEMRTDGDVLSRGFFHLLYSFANSEPADVQEVERLVKNVNYRQIIGCFYTLLMENDDSGWSLTKLLERISISDSTITAQALYEAMLKELGIELPNKKQVDSDIVYYVLINLLITSKQTITSGMA